MSGHDESCACRTCVENFELYRITKLNRYSVSSINLFTCFSCHRHFSSAQDLYAHEKTEHTIYFVPRDSPASDRAVPASTKGSKYPSPQYSLKTSSHSVEAAGDHAAAPSSIRQFFECDKCFRVFRKPSLLNDHRSVCPRATNLQTSSTKPVATIQPIQRDDSSHLLQRVDYEPLTEPRSRTKSKPVRELHADASAVQSPTAGQGESSKSSSLQCSYCDKVLTERANLRLHETIHLKGGKACWGCKKWFSLSREYDQHICFKHPRKSVKTKSASNPPSVPPKPKVGNKESRPVKEKQKKIVLPQCKRPPLSISHSLSRKRRKLSKCHKPFRCWYCTKSFSTACNRDLHHYRHQNEKHLVCSYCEVSFDNHWALYSHLKEKDHLLKFNAAQKQGLELFVGNKKTGVKSRKSVSGTVEDEGLGNVDGEPSKAQTNHESIDSVAVKDEADTSQSATSNQVNHTDQSLQHQHSETGEVAVDTSSKLRSSNVSPKEEAESPASSSRLLTLRRKSGSKIYNCSYCSKTFYSERNIQVHEATHTEGHKGCYRCKKVFFSLSEYQQHSCYIQALRAKTKAAAPKKQKQLNDSPSQTTVAQKCKSTSDSTEVRRGRGRPKGTGLKQNPGLAKLQRKSKPKNGLQCSYCDKTFTSSSNRALHQYIHATEKHFICTYCDERFQTHKSLYQHLKQKSHLDKFDADNQRGLYLFIGNTKTGTPYSGSCKGSFIPGTDSKDSSSHEGVIVKTEIDTGNQSEAKHRNLSPSRTAVQKPESAKTGKAKPLPAGSQKAPSKKIPSPKPEKTPVTKSKSLKKDKCSKRYKCTHCKRRFNQCHNLRLHEASHLGQKGCWSCKRVFSDVDEYTQHRCSKHTFLHKTKAVTKKKNSSVKRKQLTTTKKQKGIKPKKMFKCSHCNKYFSTSSNRSLHQYRHKALKVLACGYCSMSFQTHAQLYKHLATERHLLKFEEAKKQGLKLFVGNTQTGVQTSARVRRTENETCGKSDDVSNVVSEMEVSHENVEMPKLTKMDEISPPVTPKHKTQKFSYIQSPTTKPCDDNQQNTDKDQQKDEESPASRRWRIKRKSFGLKLFECSYCSKVFYYQQNLADHEASHHSGMIPHVQHNDSDELENQEDNKETKPAASCQNNLSNSPLQQAQSETIKIEGGLDGGLQQEHLQSEKPRPTEKLHIKRKSFNGRYNYAFNKTIGTNRATNDEDNPDIGQHSGTVISKSEDSGDAFEDIHSSDVSQEVKDEEATLDETFRPSLEISDSHEPVKEEIVDEPQKETAQSKHHQLRPTKSLFTKGKRFNRSFEMRYKCTYCSKAFHRIQNLETHEASHLGYRSCFYCKAIFGSITAFDRHKCSHKKSPTKRTVTKFPNRRQSARMLSKDRSISTPQIPAEVATSEIDGETSTAETPVDTTTSEIAGETSTAEIPVDTTASEIAGETPAAETPVDIVTAEITGDTFTTEIAGEISSEVPTDMSTVEIYDDISTSEIPDEISIAEESDDASTSEIPGEISTAELPDISTAELPEDTSTAELPDDTSTSELAGDISTTEIAADTSTPELAGDTSTAEMPNDRTSEATSDNRSEVKVKLETRGRKPSKGARPFKCSYCSKTFTQSTNRSRHEYEHKSTKLYMCGYCNMQFQTITHLHGHLRSSQHKLTYKTSVSQGLDRFIGNLQTGRKIMPIR